MSCNGTLNFNVKFFFTGVDSTTLEMSLSTAWRDRRSGAEQLAGEEIASFFAQVQESGDRILVQFDEKELEEDIDGKLVKRVRLAVVFCSPWLKLEHPICVIPMVCHPYAVWTARPVFYSSTCFVVTFFPGEAVAEAVYAT